MSLKMFYKYTVEAGRVGQRSSIGPYRLFVPGLSRCDGDNSVGNILVGSYLRLSSIGRFLKYPQINRELSGAFVTQDIKKWRIRTHHDGLSQR